MTVLNLNMLVSINIVLIAEELVKPNERLMSENYTNHEKHVLELNSEECNLEQNLCTLYNVHLSLPSDGSCEGLTGVQ